MLNHLHSHSQRLLKSDAGVIFALTAAVIWIACCFLGHEPIDIPNLVSMFAFILLFFIERSHGREMKAIQLKLDALIAALEGANNRLIRVEEEPEFVVQQAHETLHQLASKSDPHDSVAINSLDFIGPRKDPEYRSRQPAA